MKIDEIKKLFCSYEIDDAVKDPWKYTLAVLAAMRRQMYQHLEGYLNKEYQLFSVELKGIPYAAFKAEIISDHIREHKNNMKKMDENIFKQEEKYGK